MRIYTRSGDEGATSLYGGDRVQKDHPRIDAYGTIDELNAHLGLTRTLLGEATVLDPLRSVLTLLQNELFVLGGDLATPPGSKHEPPRIAAMQVNALETLIDRFDAEVPRLRHFVLPGGSVVAAQLHVARTVCRRAERLVIHAAETEDISAQVRIYLNRLSDLLFVLSRWANHVTATPEILWEP